MQNVLNMKKNYDFSRAKRGAVAGAGGKSRITIYLDDDILQEFRSRGEKLGRGYQTLINEALRQSLSRHSQPLDARTLRKIMREELAKAE